jgi:hypothetical protein
MVRCDVVLADYAQISEGRLFINGGGVRGAHFPAPAPAGLPYPVSFSAAGTVTFGWDAPAGDHTLGFDVVDADGHPPLSVDGQSRMPLSGTQVVSLVRAGRAVPGDECLVPFAFNVLNVPFISVGRYTVSILVDGEPIGSRTFEVTVA